MKDFYNDPEQVMYLNPDESRITEKPTWVPGIAYRDEVICGHCGAIYKISDIIEYACVMEVDGIYEYNEWIDISESIIGGELPNGLIWKSGEIIEESYIEESTYDSYEDYEEGNADRDERFIND